MKKTLIKSIALLASLGSLASCNSLTSQGNNSNTSNKDIVSQSQSIIAKQATTGLEAMKLLTNSPQTFNSVMKSRENNSTQISSQDQETITKLLNQFDLILENNNYFTSTIIESDKAEYKTKEVISFKGLDGREVSYSLYYNDVFENTYQEDRDEQVTVIKYSGIAVFLENNVETTYNFDARSETETEGREIETESTFNLYSSDSTYIQIEKENEQEHDEVEDEYTYKLYQNRRKVYEYSLGISKDLKTNRDQIELELNNKEYEIEIVERNNETYFLVEIEDDNTDDEYDLVFKKVIDQNGNVTYQLV